MHGGHLIKAYSRTQSNIALSSGEAEFYSMVAASSEAIGLKAMTKDYDAELEPWLYVDASAAIGVAQRTGLGKIRHLDTQSLWLQEAVKKGRIGLTKVKGTENPADLFTKHLSSPVVVEGLLKVFGCEYRTGRPEGAPELRKGQGTQAGALLSLLEQGYRRGRRQDELSH